MLPLPPRSTLPDPLFPYTTLFRSLSLTDDGQRFHARAGELVAAMEELETETASSGGEAAGRLRINAPLTFGNLHLAPLWPRFTAANPKVSLDITLNDRMVDLRSEAHTSELQSLMRSSYAVFCLK